MITTVNPLTAISGGDLCCCPFVQKCENLRRAEDFRTMALCLFCVVRPRVLASFLNRELIVPSQLW